LASFALRQAAAHLHQDIALGEHPGGEKAGFVEAFIEVSYLREVLLGLESKY
jgi:hypothetical protein